ncbi:MAG: hypothetical protein ACO1OB_28735 [Archangium sp.]
MRHWLIISSVLISACAPEQLAQCQRVQVNRTGQVNASTLDEGFTEAVVVGESATITVFAPLTSCVSDEVRASVELFDPDNLPAPPEPLSVETNAGVVRVEVTFTPTRAGDHFIRVVAEPNLGARSTTVTAVGRAELNAGVVIALPNPVEHCREGVWPLGTDAVVCEPSDGGLVGVFFADGGSTQFPGRDVVTAGPVLWSVTSSTLERRSSLDGGLILRGTWANFGGDPAPALQGEDFAIRRNALGMLVLLQPDEGTGLTLDSSGTGPVVFDGSRVLSSDPFCSVDCQLAQPVTAVEPGYFWSRDSFDTTFVRAWRMPIGITSSASAVLHRRVRSRALVRGPFERLPLWLEHSADEAMLAGFHDDALTLSIWPIDRVLRVGAEAVVVKESNESVRLVPYSMAR